MIQHYYSNDKKATQTIQKRLTTTPVGCFSSSKSAVKNTLQSSSNVICSNTLVKESGVNSTSSNTSKKRNRSTFVSELDLQLDYDYFEDRISPFSPPSSRSTSSILEKNAHDNVENKNRKTNIEKDSKKMMNKGLSISVASSTTSLQVSVRKHPIVSSSHQQITTVQSSSILPLKILQCIASNHDTISNRNNNSANIDEYTNMINVTHDLAITKNSVEDVSNHEVDRCDQVVLIIKSMVNVDEKIDILQELEIRYDVRIALFLYSAFLFSIRLFLSSIFILIFILHLNIH